MYMIDEKDRIIIEMLMKNARTPLTEIARKLGITDVAVKKRIKRLEKEGIILGYGLKINPTRIGYQSIAILGLDVDPEKLLSIANEIKKKEYAKYVALTTGDHVIIAEIWVRDNFELSRIIQEIGKIHGVKSIKPAIVLEILKWR